MSAHKEFRTVLGTEEVFGAAHNRNNPSSFGSALFRMVSERNSPRKAFD